MTLDMHGLLILVLGFSIVAPARGADEADREDDHEALRHLRVVFEEAVNKNQLDLLRPHLAEPFSVVTDLEFSDFDKFKVAWQKRRDELLAGGRYSVELEPQLSELYGDVAIAHGNSRNVLVTGSGAEYHFDSHWTAICRKIDGQWKIQRAHSSLDPFGNPMLKAGVRSVIIKVGAAAAVVALIVGCAMGFWHARWRTRRASPSAP